MKLSREWLSEFTKIDASDKEYADAMTLSGSKVEAVEDLGAEIKNVVVGKVTAMEHHPDSDHLWLCTVDVGQDEPVLIITGAQNVQVGDLVPAALHNSTLPGGVKITRGKLRGIVSNGMLCSLGELGLDQRDYPYAIEDGIFILQEPCEVGQDIRTVLGFDDTVVEFEITNNRPDCFSIRGLARESAVTFGTALNLPEPAVKGAGGSIGELLDVEIEEPGLCPRYTARVVKNIKIQPSPHWMRRRLRASGIRPINNIVDITNYVMLEYGQPMHAFDYACVRGGKIVVRTAREGEVLTTLDGNDRKLTTNMLVIADENTPIGVAGVMGGGNSEITADTKQIVFESANFNGVSIRKTAIALGMRTDASGRYEKGLDPLNTLPAVQRACELVELLGAGEVVDGVIDVIAADTAPITLPLEPDKINALLGTDIPKDFMVKVMTDLGFVFDGDMMTVPSWRSDIHHYSDIAEEVARFWGYNEIESTALRGETPQGGYTEKQMLENRCGSICRALGYSEIMTYSFLGMVDYDKICLPADSPMRKSVIIQNPLGEDTSVMRTTPLPSMLDALARNYSVRNKVIRFYELARVYRPLDGQPLPEEYSVLTLGAYGGKMDFFAIKGAVEALLHELRISAADFAADSGQVSYHPGRCAAIRVNGQVIGHVGQFHPAVAKNYGMSGVEVYGAELDFNSLMACRGPQPLYKTLPRFPSVLRDLALICDEGVTVAALSSCIREAGGKTLQDVKLFDIYVGPNIPEGKKSVAFSLTLRDDEQTLTDEHAEACIADILRALDAKLGVTIR